MPNTPRTKNKKLETGNTKEAVKTKSLLFKIPSSRLNSGFSLIDILLTMFLVVMFSSILLVGSGSYLTSRKSNLRTIASKIASEQIDSIRKYVKDNSSFPADNTNFSHPDLPKLPSPSRSQTLSNFQGASDIKLTTITVNWLEDTETKSVKMETLIYINGLN